MFYVSIYHKFVTTLVLSQNTLLLFEKKEDKKTKKE
jgi:hypothetical protein